MFLKRIPKPANRSSRWKSQSHLTHVRKHACVNCGSVANIQAAHVRMGSDAAIALLPAGKFGEAKAALEAKIKEPA